MLKEEFEALAGYDVTYEDYKNIIEPMYMAVPDTMSKAEFVKCIDKKRFALPTKAQMVKEMKKIANYLFDNCGVASFYEEKEQLDKIAKTYAKRFYGINWGEDIDTFVFFTNEYAYRGCKTDRGCSYPKTLIIGRGYTEYERIELVK